MKIKITHIKYTIILLLYCCFATGVATAQDIALSSDESALETDTIQTVTPSESQSTGLISRIINYFDDSNKEKTNKKLDFSIIGGPHYASDTQFGVGLVGAGIYHLDRNDPTLRPSNVTLYSDISTVGFFLLGLKSTNYFPHDRYRLIFKSSFYYFPSYYWGIGYDQCNLNNNKSELKYLQTAIKLEFLFKIVPNLYLGPRVTWNYTHASKVENPALLDGQATTLRNYGVGVLLNYDTRDIATNATRGVYLSVAQTFRASWMGNDYAFSSTAAEFSAYQKVWKGGVLAENFIGEFNFGNPSWAMMAQLGSSSSMRGYYEGRYRDKNQVAAQVELRQHVWRRSGVVAWVGAGSVFHNRSTLRHILPNYGVGYRWEFKKSMNLRLDMGFGKGKIMGFAFNVNEAF